MTDEKDISRELLDLIEQYDNDTKRILKEHSRLDYLYALADMRENLLEWYPFRPEGRLLEVGSGYGAMTGLYSRKVAEVVVLDPARDNLAVNRMRHQEMENITYVEESLVSYAARTARKTSAAGEVGASKAVESLDGTDVSGAVESVGGTDISGTVDAADEENRQKFFDYIVFVGTLTEDAREQIAAAKSLLKKDGELIAAACNPFGIKYWAGAKKDDVSFSKKELIRLLTECGGEPDMPDENDRLEFYYPMPDYRLPISVYSQSFLPGKGDLTNTLTAYDYPQYLLLDVGAAYDAVCEDGQFENFANSFLVIWRNHGTD